MSSASAVNQATPLIAGRYEVDLERPLGTGGMAVVYRGVDVETGRAVAIKCLRPEYAENPDSIVRFRQEARMMAFLSHPNVIALRGLEEDERGTWMIMDLVEGRSLKQVSAEDGPQPVAAVLPVLEQIADALDAMHGRQIVHLDIKPQNVMRSADGHVTIIDLGLAQPAGARQEMVGGTAFGTVAYLAPEQASGDAVDPSTDVYSLGCVIYELLTGRPPFEAPEGEQQKQRLIRAHIEELPTAPSILLASIPAWVDDVVGWALAKSRDERYHDAATFVRMFRSGIAGQHVPHRARTQRVPPVPIQATGSLPREGSTKTRGPSPLPMEPAPTVLQPAHRPRPEGPSVMEQLYRVGGRGIRRTRTFRGKVWRLAMIFAVGNLLLGGLIVARDDQSDLLSRFLAIAPGTETIVNVDQLNVRAGPGAEFDVLDVLPEGTTVQIAGMSEVTADGRWWPVNVERDGEALSGWVWADGLRENAWTGRMSWMQEVVDTGQSVTDNGRNVVEDVQGLWPF